jgi:hypothetical protein
MEPIDKIVQKYEVPQEYFDALWDAYQEGAKRGFITASIEDFNKAPEPEGKPNE